MCSSLRLNMLKAAIKIWFVTWSLVVCRLSGHHAHPMQHQSRTAWSLHFSLVLSIWRHHPGWNQLWWQLTKYDNVWPCPTINIASEKWTWKEGMRCSWPPDSDSDLYTQATNPSRWKRNKTALTGLPDWTGESHSPALQASWVHLAHTSQCPRRQPIVPIPFKTS